MATDLRSLEQKIKHRALHPQVASAYPFHVCHGTHGEASSSNSSQSIDRVQECDTREEKEGRKQNCDKGREPRGG